MSMDSCDLLCLDLPRAEELRHGRMSELHSTRAAQSARALGDPTRLLIACALRDAGELCGCDLAWVTERSQKLVSHHLRVLRDAGLVSSRRDGKMAMHSVTPVAEVLLAALTRMPAVRT